MLIETSSCNLQFFFRTNYYSIERISHGVTASCLYLSSSPSYKFYPSLIHQIMLHHISGKIVVENILICKLCYTKIYGYFVRGEGDQNKSYVILCQHLQKLQFFVGCRICFSKMYAYVHESELSGGYLLVVWLTLWPSGRAVYGHIFRLM